MARKGALGFWPLHSFLTHTRFPLSMTPLKTLVIRFQSNLGDGTLSMEMQDHFTTSLCWEGSQLLPINPEYLLMKRFVFFPLGFFNLVLTSPSFGPAVLCNVVDFVLSVLFTVWQLSEICSYMKWVCFLAWLRNSIHWLPSSLEFSASFV